MIYNYPSHYVYDFIAVASSLLIVRQIFALSMGKKQFVLFMAWMMTVYQINFYMVIPYFPREYKYLTFMIGFFLAYKIIGKLNYVSSMIIVMVMILLNGMWTNINLYFMLQFIFPNYGLALEAQHFQYTSYIVSVLIGTTIVLLSKVKIVDIERYS